MDIEESFEIMQEIVTQKYEDRLYNSYLLSNVMAEKPISYIEYRDLIGANKKNNEISKDKLNEIRNDANNTVEKFKNLIREGGM
ncbi:hypothetical protein [Inconstantimicrobium mannanitabidum]|uniref:hypothetical protein n=1 Tax=Inconstantimicrobium mannanitabidum TaxID=1604901 RepID=UPI0021C45434|nr:hypothetical protein [Clostridium sp. TW13]